MFRCEVDHIVDAPIATVWAWLTAHDRYDRFPSVTASELEKPGDPEPKGVGAVRRVELHSATLWEEITSFEHNALLGYRIVRSTPLPLDHRVGRIELTAQGDRTRVVWRSEGRVRIPLVGPLLDKLLERQLRSIFTAALDTIRADA